MKVISGTVTKVWPVDYTDPKWGNQYQNIIITGQSGQSMTGRIGSKNGYSGGEKITVEVEDAVNPSGHYNKFTRQREDSYSGKADTGQSSGRDYDRENHGKCFTMLLSAYLPKADPGDVDDRVLYEIGRLATACMNSYEYRAAAPAAPEIEAPAEDDIPF